jgi:hypothetical protein
LLQVITLWLGSGLLTAPGVVDLAGMPDVGESIAQRVLAVAVLLLAFRVPGLVPGPRAAGPMGTVLGALLGAGLAGRVLQAGSRLVESRQLVEQARYLERLSWQAAVDPADRLVGRRG